MKFSEAFKMMKQGIGVKLPSWGGYWWWDEESKTILMYTKDGGCMDIRETQVVDYTLQNIMSDEWIPANGQNCPILGGRAIFGFSEAIKYLKHGMKVAREGWNGKGMYLFRSPKLGCQIYSEYTGKEINDLQEFIVMKTADDNLVPWLASQTDMLAEDWIFAEGE